MRAVVLGGAGFIGTHLCQALVQAGDSVTVCDRHLPYLAPPVAGADYVLGDFLTSPEPALEPLLHQADVVYDLAWDSFPASSNADMLHDVQVNLLGTLKLLQACVQAGVGRFIFFSTGGAVYGPAQVLPIPETHPVDPLTSYGVTKVAAEKYVALFSRYYGLDYVILRPGNPFGPYQDPTRGQGVIAAFLARVAVGLPVEIWGDGSAIRDFFYVGDLVRAIRLAGQTPESRTVYNIGSGTGRSLCDVVAAISRLVGYQVPIDWRPARQIDSPANILDIGKAQARLGWSPQVPFEEALALTLTAIRQAPSPK